MIQSAVRQTSAASRRCGAQLERRAKNGRPDHGPHTHAILAVLWGSGADPCAPGPPPAGPQEPRGGGSARPSSGPGHAAPPVGRRSASSSESSVLPPARRPARPRTSSSSGARRKPSRSASEPLRSRSAHDDCRACARAVRGPAQPKPPAAAADGAGGMSCGAARLPSRGPCGAEAWPRCGLYGCGRACAGGPASSGTKLCFGPEGGGVAQAGAACSGRSWKVTKSARSKGPAGTICSEDCRFLTLTEGKEPSGCRRRFSVREACDFIRRSSGDPASATFCEEFRMLCCCKEA